MYIDYQRIDIKEKDRQYYLVFERDGKISELKCPINIAISSLSSIPAFRNPSTIDELSDFLIRRGDELSKTHLDLFKDAITILARLGKDTKVYVDYEKKQSYWLFVSKFTSSAFWDVQSKITNTAPKNTNSKI